MPVFENGELLPERQVLYGQLVVIASEGPCESERQRSQVDNERPHSQYIPRMERTWG